MRRGGPTVTVNTRRGPGLMGTMARTAVIAGTATVIAKAVSGVMGGGQKQAAAQQQAATQKQMVELQANQEGLAQQQAALQQQAVNQQAEMQASSSFDEQLVQIQKLSVMKEQGLLTEAEFNAKKAQILGI